MNLSRIREQSQAGEINILLVPVILLVLLLTTAVSFGYWAFMSRQDYKNNTEQKVAVAVETAKRDEGIAKDRAFAEQEKSPLQTYTGPSAFGSISVAYPKVWSVYVNSVSNGTQPLDAYFNPRAVPAISDTTAAFALRIQVVPQTYASVIQGIEGQVKSKQLKAAPYAFPKVPGVIGVRADGVVNPTKKNSGSMIVMPLRDKTIKIWTENAQFQGDFDNIILPNLSFVP
jgi:hypothetical protein